MNKKSFHKPKQNIFDWIKKHIIVILIPGLLLAVNRFWYLLARLITHVVFKDGGSFCQWDLPIDNQIPFVGVFSIPYILSFLYWIVIPTVIYIVLGSKIFYRLVAATLLAELLGFLWLIILPSKMTYSDYINRGDYSSDPFYGLMNTLIYKNDLPDNLSPSFHVLATSLPFIVCLGKGDKDKRNTGMLIGTGCAFVLICLAVLFVRQHYIADIFSALLIVIVSYVIVRARKWGHTFQKFNDWWWLKMTQIVPSDKSHARNNCKIILCQKITTIVIFVCLVGFMIYFGIISDMTGDPFAKFWHFGINGLYPN